jgi:hypothetical protein
MDDCNCNSSTCDCCVNKPTTIQTETTTLLTPTYFDDKSMSVLTTDELLATQNVVLNVSATLTLFNTNVLNNVAFDKTEYTFVTDRLVEGAITQTEYREFLNDYNYTVDTDTTTGTATEAILNNPKNHIEQFNDFLKGTIAGVAVSSLCRFLSDPFNNITSAASLFSNFLGGFKSLKDLLASLENPLDALSGLAASLKAFANSLINSVKDIVNSIKEKVLNVADKVSKEIAKIVGMQGPNKLSLNRWFAKQFVNIRNALSEGNIANLITDISTKIAEAVLGFAVLTLEAIEFLLFLFCKMATAVENNLMSVLDIVVNASSRIAGVNSYLLIGSGDALRSAAESGRPVPEPGTLAEQAQEIADRSRAQALADAQNSDSSSPSPRFHVPSDFSSHPDPKTGWDHLKFTTQVLNPFADDAGTFRFWTEYGDLEIHEWYHDAQGAAQEKIYTIDIKKSGIDPAIGYYGMKLDVLNAMNEVGRAMGLVLTCSSAYRHPYYNSYLRYTKNGFDGGVAKFSQHKDGNAMDITSMSPSNASADTRDKFEKTCRQFGFTWFKRYSWGIHADVRGNPNFK